MKIRLKVQCQVENKTLPKGAIFDVKKETELCYHFWLNNNEWEWLPKQCVEILNG